MKNLTPDELYKIIGQNVAKYRKEKGLSQLDLSLAMGYKSVSVVSGAEILQRQTFQPRTSFKNITNIKYRNIRVFKTLILLFIFYY